MAADSKLVDKVHRLKAAAKRVRAIAEEAGTSRSTQRLLAAAWRIIRLGVVFLAEEILRRTRPPGLYEESPGGEAVEERLEEQP